MQIKILLYNKKIKSGVLTALYEFTVKIIFIHVSDNNKMNNMQYTVLSNIVIRSLLWQYQHSKLMIY